MSKSGGAKNDKGDLRKEQLESIILGFFGAGGHVESCGIRNFCPLGVEHIATALKSMSLFFDGSCFLLSSCCFLQWLLLGGFARVLFLVVLPEGTIS